MDHSSNARLSGIWLPLITPFIDGAVDERSLARLVAHYLDENIDGLIVAATTGEGLVLDDAETEQVVVVAAGVAARRVPLFLGLCGSDTRRLVRRLAATDAWPVDGYLITCPYYTRPSQQGLYQHFAALADATDKPILIYNIPYRTGVNLGNDTLLRLAERANVVGVKDCCADAGQSADLLRRRGLEFSVLTGEDALFYGAVAQGADGGILASAHLDVPAFAAVREAVLDGRLTDARMQWGPLQDVVRLLFAEPNPAPIKHVLWRRGLIGSPELRLPMTGISAITGGSARSASARAGSGGMNPHDPVAASFVPRHCDSPRLNDSAQYHWRIRQSPLAQRRTLRSFRSMVQRLRPCILRIAEQTAGTIRSAAGGRATAG